MRNSARSLLSLACGLVLSGGLVSTRLAVADEIVLITDERGRKVYFNTGDPGPPKSGLMGAAGVRRWSSSLSPAEINRLVEQAASRHSLDPQLVHAVIQVESEYNPHAVSRKGAMGLMQLIPTTARRFGVRDPFDPKQNIDGGVNYLKHLLDLFQGDLSLSLAAYNAGENSVVRHGGIPSFQETRDYVRKVTGLYNGQPPGTTESKKPKEPEKVPIYRYVDERGVAHFTNVGEF